MWEISKDGETNQLHLTDFWFESAAVYLHISYVALCSFSLIAPLLSRS